MRTLIHYFLLFCLCLLSQDIFSQHREMHLTFNENGKLLGGYLPRFHPGKCSKDCENKYFLSVRVLLPLDYLNVDQEKIDEMAEGAYEAVNDSTSILNQILRCNSDGHKLSTLKYIIKDKDIRKWRFDSTQKLVPSNFPAYLRYIAALKQGNIKILDQYKEFAPFQLKVKGLQITDSCFRFAAVDSDNDYCHCVGKNKKFVALEFAIPATLITHDLAIDSFQLIRTFPMKTAAINWYNTMLNTYKDDLLKLKMLESNIRKKQTTIGTFLNTIDTLNAINDDTCVKTSEWDNNRNRLHNLICKYKQELKDEFGEFDCKNACNNFLLCSKILPDWIFKLIWLNGEFIRLNPFNFTNNDIVAIKQLSDKGSAAKKETARKNAQIKLTFWDTAIAHLRDSVLRAKEIDIDSNSKLLTNLLTHRMEALDAIDKNAASGAKSDVNAANMESFTTTSQVHYKGWLIP